MAEVTLKQMLEAGVHFGHQTRRWNPKMKKFIFGERNGIYIINLENTLACLERALTFLKEIVASGREILWVGTKKQAQDSVREAAQGCGMPYVNERWLGGMLTNFETVRKSVRRLEAIDKMEEDGSFQFVTKKEVLSLKKERDKLEKNLKGVRAMKKLPGAVFVIDSKNEEIAVREATKLEIPVVALLDTNCDPDLVSYPIPGNDDAIRAIKLFCEIVAATIQEGRTQLQQAIQAEEQAQRDAEEAEAKAQAEGAEGEAEDLEQVPETEEEKLAARFGGAVEEDDSDASRKAKAKKITRKTT